MEDGRGVECSPLDLAIPIHELLASLVERGAEAAAVVTTVPGDSEHILAYALVAEPRISDVRRSDVVRSGTELTLSAWEYTV